MKLELFNTAIEKEFENTEIIEGYTVYLRRDEKFTLVNIMGLNFLGKYSGNILFQFISEDYTDNTSPNKVYLKELETLSYSEIITFVKEIILNYKLNKYQWDYDHRCNIYVK
jgi:mannosyltransferase OCH1-like enzyme